MPISEVQREVWRIRKELDRRLAKMTPEQRTAHFRGVFDRIEAKFGLRLKLRRAQPGQRSPIIADPPQE